MNVSYRFVGAVASSLLFAAVSLSEGADGLKDIEKLSYDKTEKSLERIQSAAKDEALSMNVVALSIYRQTMYGLGQQIALSKAPKTSSVNMNASQKARAMAWLSIVKSRASGNDPFFKIVLGDLYSTGQVLAKSESKCIELWKAAADAGYSDANYKMGNVYTMGAMGVQRDIAKGLAYYRKAAELGSSMAMHNLGSFYNEGTFVERSDEKAFSFWMVAAEKGHPEAQRNVGGCYIRGKGVKVDMAEAKKWLLKAAAGGDPGSHGWLDHHFPGARTETFGPEVPESVSAAITMEGDDEEVNQPSSGSLVNPVRPQVVPVHAH